MLDITSNQLRRDSILTKVFINGYGNIGRRLASAISGDKEIQLIGIAKYSADEKTQEALRNHFNIYVPEEKIKEFIDKKYRVNGTVEAAVENCDIVLDAAKEGGGFLNKIKLYRPLKKPAIFQGGENRHGSYSVADMIHNSRVNYDKARGRTYVIQGSCNVSGMGRIIQPMIERFGEDMTRFDVTLIRRWADLEDSKQVKDSIEWDPNPHHQDDVKDFIPDANLYVDAYKVPSRMMHLHQMSIRFKKKAPSKDSIVESFRKEFGIAILNSAAGTAQVRKKALESGFSHGDTNMVHIHQEVVRVEEDTVKIPYSDDQTGMVIPENYLLLQSMVHKRSRQDALAKANSLFQMDYKKKVLEEEFK
jgi:glyceraldehyde-3-phosphate dehydrogenase (NAD(P))